MNIKAIFGKVLSNSLVVALAVYPIWASYDLHEHGPEPEKHLQLSQVGTINPLKDLQPLSPNKNVELKIGEQTVPSLFIANAYLSNTGKSPILPSDFHEKISVSVTTPWSIIAIENSTSELHGVKLEWKQMTPQLFEATPTLLNPGDSTSSIVYLTHPNLDPLKSTRDTDEPKLTWNARIVNLKAIEETKVLSDEWISRLTGSFRFYVFLSGKKLWFVWVAGLANLALILHLLVRARLMPSRWNWKSSLMIVIAATLSASAAECSGTYIFTDGIFSWIAEIAGPAAKELLQTDHLWNSPPILLNAIVILTLMNWPKQNYKGRNKSRRAENDVSVQRIDK